MLSPPQILTAKFSSNKTTKFPFKKSANLAINKTACSTYTQLHHRCLKPNTCYQVKTLPSLFYFCDYSKKQSPLAIIHSTA